MEFLSGENFKRLQFVFYPRTTYNRVESKVRAGRINLNKKNLIPVGVHELEIRDIVETKSKAKNWTMLKLYIHKKRDIIYEYDTDYDREHISFDDIECVHAMSMRPQGTLTKNWFNSFSGCLGRSDFDKMLEWKGKKFKAVVMNVQRRVDYAGVIKLDALGDPVLFWEAKILSVHKLKEEVKITDWFSLCKYERYDPIEEGRHNYNWYIAKKNKESLFGGSETDVPF